MGFFDIEIAFAQKLGNDLLDVFTDITRLGQRGRVRHHERHVQFARQRLRQQRFTRTGRTDKQDVGFRQFDVAVGFRVAQAFVMVVHRHRQGFLGLFLTDNMIVEVGDDFGRRGQLVVRMGRIRCRFLCGEVV